MGSEPDSDSMTPSLWWRMALSASRMLSVPDRDAVLGDLAEAGESGGAALRSVLGLVAWRQAECWNDWAPWLGLVGLAAPLGILLTVLSRRVADHSAIYLWLYVNNWSSMFVENAAFRHDLLETLAGFGFICSMSIFWAWTGGFALGLVSRGATAVNGAILCLVSVAVELSAGPQSGVSGVHAAVFEAAFYRVVFPWIVQTVLAVIPALWGMRAGAHWAAGGTMRRTVPLLAASLAAAAVGFQVWILRVGRLRPPGMWLWYGAPGHLLQTAMSFWPLVYFCAITFAWARWRHIPSKETHV
jgi:hypothetical protein